jgi:hypothetical protein
METLSQPMPRVQTQDLHRTKIGFFRKTVIILLVLQLAVTALNGASAIVIEDDYLGRHLLEVILTLEGFRVTSCPDYCDTPIAHLIIVDAIGSTGVFVGSQYITQLRPLHPTAFIVGMSGSVMLQTEYLGRVLSLEEHLYAAGANLVIQKPFDMKKVIEKMNE